MDPVSFDSNGNLVVRGPTDTPQWGPGAVSDPYRRGDSGSIPLSVHKARVASSHSKISSERPGREADFATDNNNGTAWEPADGDSHPSLMLDLGPGTEWAAPQLFTVDSSRIIFAGGPGGIGVGGGAPTQKPTGSPAFRYKIEASNDGETFQTLLDKTSNTAIKYIDFDELPPTVCRFVRLTLMDWPRMPNSHLGITEFTVFGKPVEGRGTPTARGPGK
jgi:hypothetical protein